MIDDAVTVSEAIAERVHERLAEARVIVFEGRPGVALVAGREGAYVVRARTDTVTCDCPAGARGQPCSHAAAAMVRFAERGANP
jgi:uncharacterized Zn finger protein